MKKNKKNIVIEAFKLDTRVPLVLLSLVFLAWGFIVISNYMKGNPVNSSIMDIYFSLAQYNASFSFDSIISLFKHGISLVLAAAIMLSFYGAGSYIIGFTPFRDLPDIEKTAASFSFGFGASILLLFLFGVTGLFYPPVVLGIMLILFLIGVSKLRLLASSIRGIFVNLSFFEKVLAGISLFALLIMYIGCISPETFYDSLVYHIAKPNFWVLSHKIMPDEANLISGFYPGNVNIAWAIGLMAKDETVCKCMNLAFLLLTCLVVYAMGKRFSGPKAGFFGALCFFIIPYSMIISYRTSVEMPIAFVETLAVFGFAMWLSESNNKWLVFSGIHFGLAMGSKYVSLYGYVIVLFILVIHGFLNRKLLLEIIKNLTYFALPAIIVFSPWLIYNIYYTGNPLYPFFNKYIGFLHPRTIDDPSMRLTEAARWKTTFIQILKGPWTVSMGKYEEAFIGPVILMFFPLFIFLKDKFKVMKYLFLYAALYWIIWGINHEMYVRYYMPVMPTLCFIAGYYLYEAGMPKWVKNILFLMIIFIFSRNIMFLMTLQKYSNNCFAYACGAETKLDYLGRARQTYPNSYYEMAEYINTNLPKDSKVVLMGEMRSYYFKRMNVPCDLSNRVTLIDWAGEAKTPDELYKILKSKNVTHILFNAPEARRLKSVDLMHFEKDQLKTFSLFWMKYVKEVHRTIGDTEILERGVLSLKNQVPDFWNGQFAVNPFNYVYLYEILPESEALKPDQVPANLFLSKDMYPDRRWENLQSVPQEIQNEFASGKYK